MANMCTSTHKFQLGNAAEATVECGLPAGHLEATDPADYVGWHVALHLHPENAVVTFHWYGASDVAPRA